MRILYHHRSLADGAEGIHIAEMAMAFRDLGHDVHIRGLAADSSHSARRTWVERVRAVVPGVAFELASLVGNAIDYVQTRRAIAEIHPDFLYKRHARNDIGAIYAARQLGIPTVLEVNCLYSAPEYSQLEPLALKRTTAATERRALRMSTLCLAVSTPLAHQISQLASVNAIVVPNGADPHRFDPARAKPERVRAKFGLGASLVIGWTGVIREWHGLELLTQAMAALPEARLLIVGDGPARPALERHAVAAGVAHRMVITGRIPHAEVPDYLAAMDIAVVASDRTGIASPMKLLEFMAMGRAVIAPSQENIRDVVADQENGLLFQPDDVGDLSRALTILANDPTIRARLGQAARDAVDAGRTWRSNATRVIEAIRAANG